MLIKVERAVINPCDVYEMTGHFETQGEFPIIPGSEGSGVVIASGGGMMTWGMVGRRVGFTRGVTADGKNMGGAYAEYIVTNAI